MSKNQAKLNTVYGVALASTVALVAYLLAYLLPKVGAATLAIVLGIILGNTLFSRAMWQPGTKLAESRFLEVAVVLLGFSITIQRIVQLGGLSILLVFLLLCSTLISTVVLGKFFGVARRFSLLIGGGNAICGSSAIASIAPSIGASEEEKGQSITLINLVGTIMMLILPVVATALYGSAILPTSALLGGTLPSVGQVAGASNLLGSAVAEYAMLFKIMRIAMLGLVVMILARIMRQPGARGKQSGSTFNIFALMPWYVVGFFLTLLMSSLLSLPNTLIQTSHTIGFWLEIIALAAIGLRLNFRSLMRKGGRLLPFVMISSIVQVGIAMALISVFIIL